MKRWLIVIAAITSSSCAEPPAIRLYVDISGELAIPDDVDELQVTIAANSAGARVCREETQSFDLTSTELPLYIRVVQGTEFNKSVAYWITGVRDGEEALEDRVGWITWPDEGIRDVDVLLEAGCLMEALDPACGEDEHCIDFDCLEINIPVVFRTTSALQDVSCLADPEE